MLNQNKKGTPQESSPYLDTPLALLHVAPDQVVQYKQMIGESESILLSCHARADGDAVGSLCALAQVLESMGKRVFAVVPTPLAKNLRTLPWSEHIKAFEEHVQEVSDFLAHCELLIFLDMNHLLRLDDTLCRMVEACSAPRIIIDHHLHPQEDTFTLLISETQASSTCELLHAVLVASYGEEVLTPSVAQSLFTGIVTDTGNFSYSCRPSTFLCAAHLLRLGVDQTRIREDMFGSYSESRTRLFGYSLYEQMELFHGRHASIIALSRADLDRFHFAPGDAEGLANEPLAIEGVWVSALLSEYSLGTVRISLRSRHGVHINTLASECFSGGGHPHAAGGSLHTSYQEAVEYSKRVITEYLTREYPHLKEDHHEEAETDGKPQAKGRA